MIWINNSKSLLIKRDKKSTVKKLYGKHITKLTTNRGVQERDTGNPESIRVKRERE